MSTERIWPIVDRPPCRRCGWAKNLHHPWCWGDPDEGSSERSGEPEIGAWGVKE